MISELLSLFQEFWWMGIVSFAAFLLTILILPVVIVRLPADYFVCEKADGYISRQNRGLRFFLLFLKNLAGAFLFIMGVIMLFVPGQGILTMLAGLSVMNFPGKRQLEVKLANNDKVMRSLNWIRNKGHREHFLKREKEI